MSEKESFISAEKGEVEKSEAMVWIVDDNTDNVAALLRGLKYSIHGTDFTHFQEGEQAVNQFEQIAEGKGEVPSIILMDYKLDDKVDSPKFETGVEVITELKRIAEKYKISLPEIVAFSSEKTFTDELLEAGAKTSLKKNDLKVIREYIGRSLGQKE